jgi:hypothetical protein
LREREREIVASETEDRETERQRGVSSDIEAGERGLSVEVGGYWRDFIRRNLSVGGGDDLEGRSDRVRVQGKRV